MVQWSTLRVLRKAGANVYSIALFSDELALVQGEEGSGGRWVKPISPLLWLDPVVIEGPDASDKGLKAHPEPVADPSALPLPWTAQNSRHTRRSPLSGPST